MLLYLHIPFCDSKCHYCSFNSYTHLFSEVDDYFKALYLQLEDELNRCDERIESVFIGGGTPSSVKAKYYEPIFKMLPKDLKEITIEANPNSASKAWQKEIANLGVDRISFGVQSFDAKKLKRLNRSHSPKTAIKAIEIAKDYFQRISIDLIYNCQGDDFDLLQKDLDQFFKLQIEHISCYELTIEKGTKFESLKLREDIFSEFIQQTLIKNGFCQYEVSNYGTPSLHNLGYWEYKNYIGVGAGAIGYKNSIRYKCESDVKKYIQNPFHKKEERLSEDDIMMEKIFLGLRSKVGIESNEKIEKRADELVKRGKLIKINNRYYNTNYFLADELSLYLLK